MTASKIRSLEGMSEWRVAQARAGKTVVATNGCFDLLHAGHVTYLEAARELGDLLLVGINSDLSVRELKGPNRPVNSEGDRAVVLAALQAVDDVTVFSEVSALSLLKVAKPDIYVKGGDYNIDTINQEERRFVESYGGRVVILPLLPGRSTTGTIARMNLA